jgi:hypothetical protein
VNRAGSWVVAVVLGCAALFGLIALLQSQDNNSSLDQPGSSEQPGEARMQKLPLALEAAVREGNVVVLYRESAPKGLGEDSTTLREAGQAVIPERRATLPAAYVAVAKSREHAAEDSAELRPFVDYWLGGR